MGLKSLLTRRSVVRLSVVAATCGMVSFGVAGVASASTYQCFDGDGSGLCAQALANLNVRSGPGTGYARVGGIPDGDDVMLLCWESGQSINGDTVWYNGFDDDTFPGSLDQQGFLSGWYLGTGHDPAAGIGHC